MPIKVEPIKKEDPKKAFGDTDSEKSSSENKNDATYMIDIHRPTIKNSTLDLMANHLTEVNPVKKWISKHYDFKQKCNPKNIFKSFLSFFPFLIIFRNYKLSDLMSDVISGLTVGIMHIPQGMAYGMLANVPPEYGLYTSFFPVIFYFFIGTSKHISIGTFAVVSLMMGSTVSKRNCEGLSSYNMTNISQENHIDPVTKCKVEVIVTTTFFSGIVQLILAIFQAGIVTEYLSTSVTKALTAGAAFHIFTSQLSHVFGYSLIKPRGFIKLIYMYIDFFKKITQTNVASLVMAIICIILLYLVQRFLNPIVKKKIKMPIPMEFILLVIGTSISYGFKFSKPDVFNMKVVGNIPRGFPKSTIPNFYLAPSVIVDSVVIGIVSFIVSFSMAKLFAGMEKYEIGSNQELGSYGIVNIISSFLNCYVSTASLSRSFVQYSTGGKTQLAGLVSCVLLLIVILAVGPLFHDLPNCVLAAIIIVNLKGVFLQFTDLCYHFKVSKYDGLMWLFTCLAVILSDVDIGLGLGLAFAFFTVVLRTQRPRVRPFGNIQGTEIYVDMKEYEKAKEIENVKIMNIDSALYYANQSHFLNKMKYTNLYLKGEKEEDKGFALCCTKKKENSEVTSDYGEEEKEKIKSYIVLDCGLMSFIDDDGITAINKLAIDYKRFNIEVILARCPEKVYSLLKKAIELKKLTNLKTYVTIQDAVTSVNISKEADMKISQI